MLLNSPYLLNPTVVHMTVRGMYVRLIVKSGNVTVIGVEGAEHRSVAGAPRTRREPSARARCECPFDVTLVVVTLINVVSIYRYNTCLYIPTS